MTASRAIAALAGIALLAGCTGRQTLQASFDHSEWHPSSMLRLNVASGGFVAEFRDGTMANGRFSADETRQIHAMLAAARSAGFTDPLCDRDGKNHPLRIVVSNGGQQILELDGGGERLTAPEHEACWTDEAQALHTFIGRTLEARGDDWTMPRQRQRLRLGQVG